MLSYNMSPQEKIENEKQNKNKKKESCTGKKRERRKYSLKHRKWERLTAGMKSVWISAGIQVGRK